MTDLDRADLLDAVATEDTRPEWEGIVPMVGRAELERVRVLARGGAEVALRTAYAAAIAEATKGAATGRRRYASLSATFPPPPAPRHVEAHPDLPEAARWYLREGRPPKQRGIGRITALAAYTCVLPECCAHVPAGGLWGSVPRPSTRRPTFRFPGRWASCSWFRRARAPLGSVGREVVAEQTS